MIINSLQRTDGQSLIRYECPICGAQNHNWQQVYTEINSQLKKIEKVHISWCSQQDDYVLISKS